MNEEFITCLEHIIDLEKMRMAQEQLVSEMTDKANKLGLRNRYQQPVLKQAILRDAEVDDDKFDKYQIITTGICVFVSFAIGIVSGAFNHDPQGGLFGGIGLAIIGAIIGTFLGCAIADTKTIRQAKEQGQKNYEAETAANQRAYQEDLNRYNAAVVADEQRAKNELIVKDNILQSIEDLKTQIRKTEDTLKTYYDAAGIYELYRNIVAVSYFHEYLASGICTELGGPNGAYITFKNEMYNRMKIERLDTIINYLDQLHYDNTMLRGAIEYAGYCLDDVCRKMDDMINQQKIAIEQGKTIQQQNALSLYNQECQKQRLDYLAWMEYYNTHLK